MNGKDASVLYCALLMALLSHHRVQQWNSNDRLWTAAATLHPTQAAAQWRLGLVALNAENRPLARQYFRSARAALHDIPRTDPLTGLIWLWSELTGL